MVLALVGLLFAATAEASLSQRADKILREAAAQMTHENSAGVAWDDMPIAELVARYDRGERLYIRCSGQSYVSQALLARAGIHSRLINTLSDDGPFDYSGDGHVFLEVWTGKRWVAYDPDSNRQFVDARGRAISAVKATYTRPFHWRFIASDIYDEALPNYTYAELDQAIDHAMGIPKIQVAANAEGIATQWVYRGTPENIARNQSYSAFPPSVIPVGKRVWRGIVHGSPTALTPR